MKLQAYDYTIVHRPGTKHANADCLSRSPMVSLVAAEDETIFELILSPHKWGKESKEVQKLVSKLAEDTIVKNNCLFKIVHNCKIPYIRPSRRLELLKVFHNINTGHAGVKRMLHTMNSYCYWESMASDIAEFCQNCVVCAKDRHTKTSFAYQLVLPNCAFHTVSIDIMGPMKRSNKSSNDQYIIAAVDHFTKWAEAEVISSPSARVTAKFIMSNVIARHGCPQILSTDNGSNFTSKVVSQINSSLCINLNFSAPHHPETNGSIERVINTIKSILRQLVEQNSCYGNLMSPCLFLPIDLRNIA